MSRYIFTYSFTSALFDVDNYCAIDAATAAALIVVM